MTGVEVGLLVIFGMAVVLAFRPKKQPQVVLVEMIEMFEVRRRRKVPEFVVNMAIVVGLIGFVFIMSR